MRPAVPPGQRSPAPLETGTGRLDDKLGEEPDARCHGICTSLRPSRTRYAHLGYPITACGKVFVGSHRTSENMPADRALCMACVREATGLGWLTRDEADALLGRAPRAGRYGADQPVPC